MRVMSNGNQPDGIPALPGPNQGTRESVIRVQREPTPNPEGGVSGDQRGRGEATLRAPETADRSDNRGVPEVIAAELPAAFIAEINELSGAPDQPLVLTDVEPAIADAEASICDAVRVCLDECNQSLQSCHACVSGQIGVSADNVDAVIEKCIGAIVKPIQSGVTNTYFQSYPVLGPPPSMEEVVGDILGTPVAPEAVLGPPKQGFHYPPQPNIPPPLQACDPGFHWGWSQQFGWVCVPDCKPEQWEDPVTHMCRAAPPADQGGCEYVEPCVLPDGKPCDEVTPTPPCPKPTQPCPEGYQWVYDEKTRKWECFKGGVDPSKPPPDQQGGQGQCKPPGDTCASPSDIEHWDENLYGFQGQTSDVQKWFGFDFNSPSPPADFGKALPTIVRIWLWGSLATMAQGGQYLVKSLVDCFGGNKGCSVPELTWISVVRSVYGFLKQWIGVTISPLEYKLEAAQNFSCPTGAPSPAEADALWIRGIVSDHAHDNLRRLYNLCPEYADGIRDSLRSRISIPDAFRLLQRKKMDEDSFKKIVRAHGFTKDIDVDRLKDSLRQMLGTNDYMRAFLRKKIDDATLEQRLKELGYTEKDDRDLIQSLAQFVPGPADLVSFMVRDAFDDNLAAKYGYDDEFGVKFSQQALLWAKAQGIDADTMKYYWRAHWRNPSPDFLFRALQRLRPDSLDPAFKAQAITENDVKTFLKIDDYQPWWIDKYIALAKEPMRMIDLRQAYDIGLLTDAECSSGLKDLGYSDYAVDKVFKFWQLRKKKNRWSTAGGMTARKILKLYKDRVISRQESSDYLQRNGIPDAEIPPMLDDATLERQYRDREREIKALQRRYRVGDIEPNQIMNLLTDTGLNVQEANELSQLWEIELQLRGKEIAAGMLCKWRYRGLITPQQQWIRLVRVGYSQTDATRIVAACEADALEWADKENWRRDKEAAWYIAQAKKLSGGNGRKNGAKK